MTRFAAVHAHRLMLIHERPALFRVALQAGLFVRQSLFDHSRTRRHAPRRSEGAVRVMAVGAYHHSFVNPVFERHGELRPHIVMAAVAQVDLAFREQEFRDR